MCTQHVINATNVVIILEHIRRQMIIRYLAGVLFILSVSCFHCNGSTILISDTSRVNDLVISESFSRKINDLINEGYKFAGNYFCGMCVIERNGKSGFIDKNGDIVVPCIYVSPKMLNDSLFSAYDINSELYGIIDVKGRPICSSIYEDITLFDNQLARVKKGSLFGFVNTEGKEIIPCIYDDYKKFEYGLCPVRNKDKWGLINIDGKQVVPFIYDYIYSPKNGFRLVERENKKGVIDSLGKEVIPCIYDNVDDFNFFETGFACVEKDGKEGIINKDGRMVIPCNYDCVVLMEDNYIYIEKDGKYGYADINGNVTLPIQRKTMREVDEELDTPSFLGPYGLTPCQKGKYVGFMNLSGEIVIPCQYKAVLSFSREPYIHGNTPNDFLENYKSSQPRAFVIDKTNKIGMINMKGEYIIKPKYELYIENDWHIEMCGDLFIIGILDWEKVKWGCFDIDGNVIIPYDTLHLTFDLNKPNDIRILCSDREKNSYYYYNANGNIISMIKGKPELDFFENISLLIRGDKYGNDRKFGYVDIDGKQIYPCIFDEAGNFSEGIALVELDGKQGFVDKYGNATLYERGTDYYNSLFQIKTQN